MEHVFTHFKNPDCWASKSRTQVKAQQPGHLTRSSARKLSIYIFSLGWKWIKYGVNSSHMCSCVYSLTWHIMDKPTAQSDCSLCSSKNGHMLNKEPPPVYCYSQSVHVDEKYCDYKLKQTGLHDLKVVYLVFNFTNISISHFSTNNARPETFCPFNKWGDYSKSSELIFCLCTKWRNRVFIILWEHKLCICSTITYRCSSVILTATMYHGTMIPCKRQETMKPKGNSHSKGRFVLFLSLS